MTILEKIKAHKIAEVATRKSLFPTKLLELSPYFESECVSMKKYLSDPFRSGIIAEFKRKSPSKGDINQYADVQEITLGYMQSGAAALSVLTDEQFFGARKNDLQTARKFNYCPILRKDFIIDEYQLIESKSMGADTVLLIAKMLPTKDLNQLCSAAKKLGMEVLMEFQNEEEIRENLHISFDIAGINNRNLNSFSVDIENSLRLVSLFEKNVVKIAESGIESAETLKILRKNGFDGFLIGEYFMRNSKPADQLKELIKNTNHAH